MGGGSGIGTGAPVAPVHAPYHVGSNKTTTSRSYKKLSRGHGMVVGDTDSHSTSSSRLSIAKTETCEDNHLPPVGLKNVGNTCYANAALQCILSTALSHALLDPKSTHIFRRYSSNPGLLALGSGSVDSQDFDSDHEFENDSKDAKEKRRSVRRKVRETRRKNREKFLKHEKCQWITGELTDITRIYTASHLNLIGDQNSWQSIFHLFSVTDDQRVVDPGGITRHVNKLSPCLRPYQQEDAHEFLRSLLSSLTLDGHNKQLSSLFDGLLESAVTCQTCHRASITRDRYMDLSLDIQGDVRDLMGALRHFTQTELLDKDNKVNCARCGTKQVVSKGLRLATAPTVLVCHLKRFAFDIYGRATRLPKFVEYPLCLEIGDFMSRANQSKPPPYELVGVLVHAGRSCERGHYLSFIKCGETWYRANDESVVEVSVDVVLQQQAYILFYEVEGMRIRHGYKGFQKYHRHKNMETVKESPSCETLGVSADCGLHTPKKKDDEISPPNTVSSFLDGMMNLCGSVETVRDAFCDSDRKSKNGKKYRRDYIKESEPLPSSSSYHSPQMSSKKRSRRRNKDAIFRKSSDRSTSGAQSMSRLRERLPDLSRDYGASDCELSVLSTDSKMIRSVSSNNIFEKQEEAINLYENESYTSRSPRKPRQISRQQIDRSVSPPAFRFGDRDEDRRSETGSIRVPSLRLRKSSSAPRSRLVESLDTQNKSKIFSPPVRPKLSGSLHSFHPPNTSDPQLPPLCTRRY